MSNLQLRKLPRMPKWEGPLIVRRKLKPYQRPSPCERLPSRFTPAPVVGFLFPRDADCAWIAKRQKIKIRMEGPDHPPFFLPNYTKQKSQAGFAQTYTPS